MRGMFLTKGDADQKWLEGSLVAEGPGDFEK